MRTLAKWSVNEYHELIKKGLLDHKKVELLNGELIEMAPESPIHSYIMQHGNHYLHNILSTRAIIREGHPITLTNSEPEPDLAIIKLPESKYRTRHPNANDILWLIEVSNSTLAYDLGDKKDVYQQEGIQEYWVIDVQNQRLHIFKDLVDGQYSSSNIYVDGIVTADAFSDVEISVAKLLN